MKAAVLPFVVSDLKLPGLHTQNINDCLSCGTSFRIVHTNCLLQVTLSKNCTGTCCYHHGNLSFFLPMINGPEFRFHLVPWLPHSADRHYPNDSLVLSLRLSQLYSDWIKNLYFDRIQFGTCTPKESCTE